MIPAIGYMKLGGSIPLTSPYWYANGNSSASVSGNITPSYPAGTIAGDIVFLLVHAFSASSSYPALSTPANFTLVGSKVTSSYVITSLFYRRASTALSGTVTVSCTNAESLRYGVMSGFRGAIASGTPYANLYSASAGGKPTIPGITISYLNSTALFFASNTIDYASTDLTSSKWTNVFYEMTTVGRDATLMIEQSRLKEETTSYASYLDGSISSSHRYFVLELRSE